MTPRGLEPENVTDCNSSRLQNQPETGGAESGALFPDSMKSGDDLQRIIDAWPTLAEPVKAGILAMVESIAMNQSI
jgi:hypothetical protein